MKRLRLQRVSQSIKCTMGVILNDHSGLPICVCLESPDLYNQIGKSCIPKGVYACEPYSSEKYKDVYKVKDVPGRTYILIHTGNTGSHTKGCILPGKMFGDIDGEPAVLSSGDALKDIRRFIGNDQFELIVS